MKICCISDTHGAHKYLNLMKYNNYDMLVHTGDFTASRFHHEDEAIEFIDWMEQQPFRYKLLVAGNHDFYPYYNPITFKRLCEERKIIYLQDSYAEIENLLIYGSPWTPRFMRWAFMKDELELEKVYSNISKDTDILLTHGPAYGILDNLDNRHIGSTALRDTVDKLNLKAHIFGHIHYAHGKQDNSINCAIMSEDYRPINKPIKFKLKV